MSYEFSPETNFNDFVTMLSEDLGIVTVADLNDCKGSNFATFEDAWEDYKEFVEAQRSIDSMSIEDLLRIIGL